MTLALAIIGTVLGILNLLWSVWTWHRSSSRVQVKTTLMIFPGVVFTQMLTQLAGSQLPPELGAAAKQVMQQSPQLAIPPNLGYPASPELIAAVPPEAVMLVATITNIGRLPVTIQRCQWRTSQPGSMEAPNTPPGVVFPYRLGENDQCISVISLAAIMAPLDAPLRDKKITAREAWPTVEVANLRKPVLGNRLEIPTRIKPQPGQPEPPAST